MNGVPATTDKFLAEKADAIRSVAKNAVFEIGRHLTEARAKCEHGKWLPWLEREFAWSRQTADNYMNVFEAVRSGKLPTVGNLDFDKHSLYLLAAPSTPEAARVEVVARAEAGEILSNERVKATVAKHRSRLSRRRARPAPTSRPARRHPAAELNSLAWSEASMEARRKFVSVVGVKSIWDAMDEAGKAALKALVASAEPDTFPRRAEPGLLLKGAGRP